MIKQLPKNSTNRCTDTIKQKLKIKKEEKLKLIFEQFYRVDTSRNTTSGGAGLGLAIVKHIAVMHKAELKIESELGKGTEIKILFNA